MIRFFTEQKDVSAKSIRLNDEDIKHIRSLRLRPDEQIIVCDGAGCDYVCKLSERNDGTSVEIVDSYKSSGEPTVQCRVYMAYSKGDRLDFAVQKSVELGVHEIILFESERCVAVPNNIPKKVARLQRIALETAKQSGRGIIPAVSSGGNFNEITDDALHGSALTILFYECEDDLHIRDVLDNYFPYESKQANNRTRSISLITGPEGGFEQHEAETARSKGIKTVSLGSRILRSETAPMAALTAIMYQTGNL